jgi:hypothetical protein
MVLAAAAFGSPSLQAQQGVTTPPNLAQLSPRMQAYWAHKPDDAFSLLLDKVEAKKERLNTSSQEALTRDLMRTLGIPFSSQLLVYSGSASQGRLVNPNNARGVYFNDEVYIGMVARGFVEVIGIDSQFGGVFYSFEKMKVGSRPEPERSQSCMGCHATTASGQLPGMIARSVIPFSTGGNHESFVRTIAGHQIPLSDRFGGWCVTSAKPLSITTHEGMVAMGSGSNPLIKHLSINDLYDTKKHITRSSDILAHLTHEHQMGFINRMTALLATARERAPYSDDAKRYLDPLEMEVVRYLLFKDEAALPPGGIEPSPKYAADFIANRKSTKSGLSLKDLDMEARMFKHRCSYMIYTRQWQLMPPDLKVRLYTRIKAALKGEDPDFAYLPTDERRNIVTILRETLPDLPADWR